MDADVPHDFAVTPAPEALKQSLRRHGVALVRGYLDAGRVARLRDEVRTLAYREHPKQLSEGSCRLGRYDVDEAAGLGMREMMTVVEDDFLSEVARDFFVPHAPDLHKIYCHHDVDVMAFNNAWHFDRGLTLKFFFYLNDVDRTNGAFWYDRGSHRANAVKQHLWWETGMPILNYVPPEEVIQPTAMEGAAGTLIVFDASGYHQAGTISAGGERWVVRFHVRAGARGDGVAAARNPYARRNWEYRSACFSMVESEQQAPWEARPPRAAEPARAEAATGVAPAPKAEPPAVAKPGRGLMTRLRRRLGLTGRA